MTKEDAAAELNGNEYGSEGSKDLWTRMKAAGLVAVFGYSDDGMELRGAIDEEYGAGTILIDTQGALPDRDSIDDDDTLEDFFVRRRNAVPLAAKFDSGGFTFQYETAIPHAKFVIVENDSPDYCEGIVFALADAHQ